MHDTIRDGMLTNWLAVFGALSLIYWGWRAITALLHRKGSDAEVAKAAPVVAAAPAVDAPPVDDIPAIAAAVAAAMGGAHRIVHLESLHPDPSWAVEGRMKQRSSHSPR